MTQVITTREIKGWMPKKIYMARIKSFAVVKYLYEFYGDVPEEFVEAERCQS